MKVRIERNMLDAIDAAITKQADATNRPEMIRRMSRDWLTSHGFLAPAPLDDAATLKAATLKHDATPSRANALKTMDEAIVKAKASGLRKRLAKAKG